MKAVVYKDCLPIEDSNCLFDFEVADPTVEDNDILVKIEAVGINPLDTKVRKSKKPENGYGILGWDASGIVVGMGKNVKGFNINDEVYYAGAIQRNGCNAELHAVDYRIVAKKPKTLDFVDAVALPLTTLTAWEGLFDRLKVSKNENECLMVVGAAGGVGSILIQIAKKLTNLKVIATASRPESEAWVTSLGADYTIDHSKDIKEQLKLKNIPAPKYIYSTADTNDKYFNTFFDVIKPQGSILLITLSNSVIDTTPIRTKSLSLNWEYMFTRSLFATEDMGRQGEILKEMAELVDKGQIKTTANQVMQGINASNIKKAHSILESGKSIGKIVIKK